MKTALRLTLWGGLWCCPGLALATVAPDSVTPDTVTPDTVTPDTVTPDTVSLDQALRRAFAQSPDLAEAEATIAEAEGRSTTAGTFPHNPALSGEAGARLGPGDTALDWAVGLEQTLPLGGRLGHGRAVAAAELAAARATADTARRALAVRVRIAFLEALRARDLLAIEAAQIELARSLLGVATKRFDAGASTRLDVNLARVDVGRAEGRLHAAEARYAVSRAQLAESMGSSPSHPVRPTGTLEPVPGEALPALPILLEGARRHRTEMLAAAQARIAARSRVEQAAAGAIPELGVSVFFRREAGTESIVGGGLSIPLPLFDRNRGAVAEAEAVERRTEAEQRRLNAQIEREVVAALAELTATRASAAGLREQIVGTLDENLKLLQAAFESGKIAGAEVLVFRQQFRDSHVELVEASAAAELARVQLEAALGQTPIPTGPTGQLPQESP
jgi:cobalt-zinc-cadmium efflux system outer membrane protein